MSSLSKKHGDLWEAYVRQECLELARRGEGLVGKNWEAPKVRGSHASREKSKPDFSGVLKGGRHIVFECKATMHKNRFDCRLLAEHQREHLLAAQDLGALAFVYVLDGSQRKWLLPVEAVEGASVVLEEVATQKADLELFTDTAKRMGGVWRKI